MKTEIKKKNQKDLAFKLIVRLAFYKELGKLPFFKNNKEFNVLSKRNKWLKPITTVPEEKFLLKNGFVPVKFMRCDLIKLSDSEPPLIPFGDQEIIIPNHQSVYLKELEKLNVTEEGKVSHLEINRYKNNKKDNRLRDTLVVRLKQDKKTFDFLVKLFKGHGMLNFLFQSDYFQNLSYVKKDILEYQQIINSPKKKLTEQENFILVSREIVAVPELFYLFLQNKAKFREVLKKAKTFLGKHTNKNIAEDLIPIALLFVSLLESDYINNSAETKYYSNHLRLKLAGLNSSYLIKNKIGGK